MWTLTSNKIMRFKNRSYGNHSSGFDVLKKSEGYVVTGVAIPQSFRVLPINAPLAT